MEPTFLLPVWSVSDMVAMNRGEASDVADRLAALRRSLPPDTPYGAIRLLDDLETRAAHIADGIDRLRRERDEMRKADARCDGLDDDIADMLAFYRAACEAAR